jgi:5-methylthioadenosine/S-adenosylhomocysteine deaminase
LVDDVFEAPRQDMQQLAAVFDAYADIGIRALVSGHIIDRNFLTTIPFTDEYVPAELRARIGAEPPPSPSSYITFAEAAFQRFHNLHGRLRFMVAPSAPQRCTPELMQAADELARRHGS